ncbi:fimbrial protein [Serratia marcescens]|uniref:fimbrial protein n=1 Tax=Serratia marcescens TaxID=615 RepID=UPI0009357701|nr:fimbrial protein [Serratia marcescens]
MVFINSGFRMRYFSTFGKGAALSLIYLAVVWPVESLAFHCRVDGKPISGGEENLDVTIGPQFNDGKNTFLDMSSQVRCWNDGGYTDTLSLNSGRTELNRAVFSDMIGGATANGVDYNIPVPAAYIMTLKPWVDEGEGRAKPLPLKMYFLLDKGLGKQLHVKKGDYIGSIGFIMRNNVGDSYTYTWKLYSKNDADINTSVCRVTTGDPINVSFGELERMDLGTAGTSDYTINKDFNISCSGPVVDFNVQMNANPVSWNNDAIQTSNSNVGVVMRWNGNVMTTGSSQSMSVNGSSTVKLSFTPVRPSAVSPDNISTGNFNTSATLVVSQQ